MRAKAFKVACTKIAFPEVFELPRKFNALASCLREKAFKGRETVVAEARLRGVYVRYVQPYDTQRKVIQRSSHADIPGSKVHS
ncbi:MAG: hypothetical protein QXD08_09095 [Pyrobaculum sp.]